MPTLTIQLAGLPPVAHVLKDDTITIGRMKGNTIVIEDTSISLSHAKITRKNGEYYLKDLNSTNGTIVNGQTITEAKLNDRDRVRFADISGQFFQADTVVPAGATTPSPLADPVTAGLPAHIPLASPSPVPAPAPKSARRPARTFNFKRLATSLAAGLGGLAALGVVGLIAWRMLVVNEKDTGKANDTALPIGLAQRKREAAESQLVAIQPKPLPETNPAAPAAATAPSSQAELAQLVNALKAEDTDERRRAARTLHALGPETKDAVPALRVAIGDADPEVRMWSALTLINDKCYDKATIPILVGVLQNENPVLRQVACLSLGLIPYEDAEKEKVIPALTETAGKDADDDVRKAAVSALGIIAPDALAKAGLK